MLGVGLKLYISFIVGRRSLFCGGNHTVVPSKILNLFSPNAEFGADNRDIQLVCSITDVSVVDS